MILHQIKLKLHTLGLKYNTPSCAIYFVICSLLVTLLASHLYNQREMSLVKSRIQGAVLGHFLGDASALGYHWIYDTSTIPQPTTLKLEAPRAKWHNPGLKPGAFTHYGEQSLVLLNSLGEERKYDLNVYWTNWKQYWNSPASALTYRDGATKNTFANIEKGIDDPHTSGSTSSDFSAVGRFAPLLLAFDLEKDEAAFLNAVKDVIGATHNNPDVIDSANLFARATLFVIKNGTKPIDAIKQALGDTTNTFVLDAVESGIKSASESDSTATIAKFGSACNINGALPSTIHIIAKYNDLNSALSHNLSAGGDNAARAGVIGILFGAYQGIEGIPEVAREIAAYPTIQKLIQ